MSKVVQFGAGNVARGFTGALVSVSGHELVFADVVDSLLSKINLKGEYEVRVVNFSSYDVHVSNISAVKFGTGELLDAVSSADLVLTAIGDRLLPYVAPELARCIRRRMEVGNESFLNVIACEKACGSSSSLHDMTAGHLDERTVEWMDAHVGFPDCVNDRFNIPGDAADSLDVSMEQFCEWEVDSTAVKGTLPLIQGLKAVPDIKAYEARKLCTHNMAHVMEAYIGKMKGLETTYDAILDTGCFSVVRNALLESGEGLVRKFGFDPEDHSHYISDILLRHRNASLRDLCTRVGREPIRKLGGGERLVFPLMMLEEYGLKDDDVLLGIGAALHFDNPNDAQSVEMLRMVKAIGVREAAIKYIDLKAGSPLVERIAAAYRKIEKI